METMTKPAKNGQQKTNSKAATNGKTIKAIENAETGKIKPVNIQDRIKKINNLVELGKQRQSLIDRKEQIQFFEFRTDTMKDRLIIEDGQGNRFETSNSNLIESLSNYLKQRIAEKIVEVEQAIVEAEL